MDPTIEQALNRATEALATMERDEPGSDALAQEVWDALRVCCRAAHAMHMTPGHVVLRGFCVCGYNSIGSGSGDRCQRLHDLAEPCESAAAWRAVARQLLADVKTSLAAPGGGR